MSTSWDTMSTSGGYHEYIYRGDVMSTQGVFSTLGIS